MLQSSDTLFFATGSYEDITNEVLACVATLTQTGFNWILEQGNGAGGTLTVNGVTYEPGDNITDWVNDVINDSLSDWMDDGTVSGADDYDGILDAIASDYGAQLSYFNQTEPALSGLSDPNLFQELENSCGLVATMYTSSPDDATDPVVIGYVNDNNPYEVTVTFGEELRVMDVYWQILELELDDLQAYQFREYNGETVYDYSFLLRFEKQD
jgi:hypothetical protein